MGTVERKCSSCDGTGKITVKEPRKCLPKNHVTDHGFCTDPREAYRCRVCYTRLRMNKSFEFEEWPEMETD